MRLLVVLHENPVGYHDDWRRALLQLRSEGTLEQYAVVPFAPRQRSGVSGEEILSAAAELRATGILWCHTSNLEVSGATLSSLRHLPSRPVFGYWEGDMYQWPFKPFARAARRVARAADVVFVPGYSSFSEGLRRSGCADVRYAPSPTDETRYGGALGLRNATPEFDVVMIGNRVASRAPGKTMPGARERMELVRLFEQRLGPRFAVFGTGWEGRSAQGPIGIREQGDAYAAGHIALGNNHIHAAYCFSNRLPIAMTCGAILVHGREAGFDAVFGRNPPLRFFRDAEDAWSVVRRLLEVSGADLQDQRTRAREFALSRLSMVHVQRYMVAVLSGMWQSHRGHGESDPVPNPWIGGIQLRDALPIARAELSARRG
jgi:hypothetical protein